MNTEQIRKDFEEWMGDGGTSPRAIERNSKGDYRLMPAAHAWEVWKAAHTHYAKPAAPVVPPEPFGYFKPFVDGWMDCKETDEGARPLYEAPQPQADALDAERLEWLVGEGNAVVQAGSFGFWVCWIDGENSARDEYQLGEYPTAREAIDAAIAAAKENK